MRDHALLDGQRWPALFLLAEHVDELGSHRHLRHVLAARDERRDHPVRAGALEALGEPGSEARATICRSGRIDRAIRVM